MKNKMYFTKPKTQKRKPLMSQATTAKVGAAVLAVTTLFTGLGMTLTSCKNNDPEITLIKDPAFNGNGANLHGIIFNGQGQFTQTEIDLVNTEIKGLADAGLLAQFAGYVIRFTRTKSGGLDIKVEGKGKDARAIIYSDGKSGIILEDLEEGKKLAYDAQNPIEPGPVFVIERESTEGNTIRFYVEPGLEEHKKEIAGTVDEMHAVIFRNNARNVSSWTLVLEGDPRLGGIEGIVDGLGFKLDEDGKAMVFSNGINEENGILQQQLGLEASWAQSQAQRRAAAQAMAAKGSAECLSL